MLKLSNIVKDYDVASRPVHALRGVSIAFRPSEFVAILGHSGCGKTTLLNIIGGLDRYTSGDLIIRGRSTKHFKNRDWDTYRNHSVGFVFQSYNLIPHQTVLANVELALTLSGEYIFSGNFRIEATNHGLNAADRTYGKCISGGLVGKGYFNILGTTDNNSQILINDGKGLFEVIAVQSQTAKHESYNNKNANGDGDIEHCIASLTFGLISSATNNTTISDIDVYATKVLVNAVRENGSRGMGDVRVAGFNGYSNGTSYNDINLYINSLDQVVQHHTGEGEPDVQNGDAPGGEAHGQQVGQGGDIVGGALQGHEQAQADEADQTHVQEGGGVAAQVEIVGGDLAGLGQDLPQAGEGIGPVGHQEGRNDEAGADEAHEQLQKAALIHGFEFVHLLHLDWIEKT